MVEIESKQVSPAARSAGTQTHPSTRFVTEQFDDGEGVVWKIYDTKRRQPLNDNGFFCVSTYERQIDALIACVELNDGEDGIL